MSGREDLRTLLNTLPRLAQLDGRPVAEVCRELGLDRARLLELIQTASALRWGGHGEGDLVDIWLEEGRLCVHTGGLFEEVVRLVPQELLALRLGSAQLLAAGLDVEGGLERLLERIEAGLGGATPAPPATVVAEPDPALDPATLDAVLRAHRECRLLRLWYFSRRAERLRPRLVEAWRPFQESGIWYLHALDRELRAERVFRLDRIARLHLLDETFTPPDAARLGTSGAMPGQGPRRARLRASGVAARLAREQGWPGQSVGEDGRVLLDLSYDDPDAFLRSLLPMALHLEVLAPDGLLRDWLALLDEMRRRHRGAR
jgi:predicted DNA-binding transcriptional regulator YafY